MARTWSPPGGEPRERDRERSDGQQEQKADLVLKIQDSDSSPPTGSNLGSPASYLLQLLKGFRRSRPLRRGRAAVVCFDQQPTGHLRFPIVDCPPCPV